ncbi:MAG TPA: 3-phosphoserine/phosphohydroxythreonine transaminase [Steroidobacteraceae bacterium]|jgi:phosphoserine aminotransferase|nr:3-phosphoserine/phosphohydroxythreonine transaminase [Steroidobacteraceae bacterium]
MSNALNFSGGPGALPASVLLQAQQAVLALPETGLSVLGMSHRSDWFRAVLDETECNLRALLGIPADYHVLFLQGGSSLQFSTLPMSFLRGTGRTAEYIVSGYWSAKAPAQARLEGNTRIVWDGAAERYRSLPVPGELQLSPDAAYLHYVSNETVEGVEFSQVPGLSDVPLVCDMSSNFSAAPLDVGRYHLIYAHAQKNLGPAGVTLVILRNDFLQRAAAPLPAMLDYRAHAQARSLYNTPPVFAIYVLLLVTRWLRDEVGGVAAMAALNRAKADLIYGALDAQPDFFRIHARRPYRSTMNVAFRLPDPAIEAQFQRDATVAGFTGLAGHRSIGGLRISLYNAVTLEAAATLAAWLSEFQRQHG